MRPSDEETKEAAVVKRWITGALGMLLCLSFLCSSPVRAGVNRNVHFAPGSSGTVIDGMVLRGDNDIYTLRAGRGQTLHCSLRTLAGGGAVFTIVAPDGNNLSEGDSKWSGQLPAAGTYKIIIVPSGGNTKYSLNISIR